jgi:putative addiction module component (TIGR02574 family)
MSTKELTREAMALPLAERVALAQSLWQSIDGPAAGSVETETKWAVEESARRDAEMTSGKVTGRSHEDVMRAARKAIE